MRIDIREVDAGRVVGAIKRRIVDVPDRVAWAFGAEGRDARVRMEAYRNRHAGQRCFVIANGPSLKQTDMSLLKNEITFSMNRAYLMYEDWGFTPTYYTCINELVLEQFRDDIVKLPMPKFVNFNRRRLFGGRVNYLRLPPRLRESFTADSTLPMTAGGTVTYATLQLAYFMGFSEVVIIGMDHKFAEKGTPGKTEVRSQTHDQSHMHPDYFPKGIKWQLPDLVRSEHAYRLARQAYEQAGRKIVDATVGGACPVFEKAEFESLF